MVDIGPQSQFLVYQEIVAWATLVRTSNRNSVSDVLWDETGFVERLLTGSSRQIDTNAPEMLVQVYYRGRF